MQDTEWEDVVVGNSTADTDWEDVKPVTQSVLDNRDGNVYNVPLAMDGIDTTFAIDTQHKGADKGSFFGKVFMDVAKMTTALTTGSMAAKTLPDEANFERVKAPTKGFVGIGEGFVDNFLTRVTNLRENQRIAAGKTFNKGYGDPLRDIVFEWEAPTAEEQEEAQKLVDTAQQIRKANKDWWTNTKEAIKPEEEMDELDRFNEQLAAGAGSVITSIGSMLLFKNPTVGAAVIASEYGNITGNEYMDKALEQGMDYDEAYTLALGRGGIEAGLELVADQALAKIANLKAIQDISNRVLSTSLIKAAQSKLGRDAIKKIGTRHTNSVFGAAAKGFVSEGGTEGLQESLGMFYDNLTGVEDYSLDQILGQTLMSIAVGGITGGVAGGGSTAVYNREVTRTNESIKSLLLEQTPELSAEETQVMADALQEMLYQESTGYMSELNKVMEKELAPDARQDGLTPEQLTAETRKLLKEKYKMSDEQIDKTIQSSLGIIDARNQFNEVYSIFNEILLNKGRLAPVADAEARLVAARALSVARAEGTQVKDVLDRWHLQFMQSISENAKNDDVLEQAMYKSKLETIEQFVDDVFDSKDTSARYFTITSNSGVAFDLPRDTVLHDKKHNLSSSEWKEVAENIDSFESVSLSDKSIYNGQSVLLKVKTPSGKYGVVFEHMSKGRNIITTAFKDTDANIDNWIKNNSARAMQKAPTTQKGLLSSRSIADIISNLDNNVNSSLKQQALFQESLDIANQNAELDANNPAYEGETIDINGVERTVYNSNGDRIAMSEPALRNFYNWFGDSKVVDEQGRPLIVYHGTNKEFDSFDKSKQKGSSYYGKGFYFTNWSDVSFYGSNKISAYINVKNPLIVKEGDINSLLNVEEVIGEHPDMTNESKLDDFEGWAKYTLGYRNSTQGDIEAKLLSKGYDGLVILDNEKGRHKYIAFNPNQIKSTSNRGTYSESDNIYYQSAFAGSRVDYDRPSLEAIGSGEGAQAHGWGLYYALSKDVAEGYRKAFYDVISHNVAEKVKELGKEEALEYYKQEAQKAENRVKIFENEVPVLAQKAREDAKAYNQMAEMAKTEGKGQVHEVDIPENPYLLDEDLYFKHQSEFVKEKLARLANDYDALNGNTKFADALLQEGQTGRTIYNKLAQLLGNEEYQSDEYIVVSEESKKQASQLLESYGVKGITYMGRRDGRCFVIFNPDDVKVIQKFYQDSTNGPRGAYKNSIIYLFENADASTVIHELGHFFLDDMQKFADNETTKQQLDAIYKFVGSTDGKLTPEQHEYFANAFELYLLDGKAPNKVLEGVFVRFRKWLSRMWSEIKRISYVKLTPEIRKTFDQMLGGRGLDFAMQMSGARMAEALESGTIPPNVVAKAIDLLDAGKMSRADMDDLIARMKTGELKRKDFNQELKKFENSNVKHNERLNPFDKVKYKDILSKGNFSKKDVLEKINRLLKWSEPRSQNGKLVGRFSNLKMNQQFDHIRELMAMEKAQAKEKIAENIALINAIIKGEEVGDTGKIAFDNKILSIAAGKANASLLVDVYNAISDSYNLGRLTTAVTGEAKKARTARMIQEAKDVITGDGRVNWRKEQSKLKQFVNQLGLSQMSWQGILDILSMNDKSSKTGQSKLSKELDVFDAQQKEAQGVADDGEKASKLMEKRLKGVGNSAISVSRYVNTKLEEKFTIEWNGSKKTFTKDQLLDIYMKSKDPETKKMMAEDKVLRYDDSFLFEVNQVLTAEDRAIADALFEFYDENYEKVNAFYEEKYGVSLGKRAFYSPRSMERGGINVDTGDLSSYVGFSGVKERKAKAGAVKIKGAFQVLQDYIINSNHWIAWSDKLIDINAVMGDVEIKNMIRNLFGENMEKRIGYEVSRMASNDKFQSKFGYGKLFNKIRSNYAIAALAAKPSLMIKQLTSFPAYWEHMSTVEFMTGLADFAVHMKEAVETLGNTTLMKTRDVNIIKDFEELSKSELFKKNANKVKLRELLMANIKLGDRGAIYMGGWALYKAELKKNLAKGMAEEKAKALALEKFERVTDETQQSGRLSQQSYWQSNPFLRAFTMFQSSQNQYLRKEISAIRGLLTGRADGKQAAKALFIFHVLLPCFFQYASDGFDWDEKAQLRAALLGSLNGIFVLNGIMERGLDVALGTADAWRATQVGLRDVIPFWGSGEDMAKFFINLAEGDIDLEDYIEVMRAFGKPLGELTGVPVKYHLDVIQNFGSYAEEGEIKKEVLLWLGWSPYALRDKEEQVY